MKIVLVGSRDRQLEDMLRSIATHVAAFPDLTAFGIGTGSGQLPNVLVIDIRNDAGIPPSVAALRRAHPNTGIVVVASRLDPAMMLDAMRAGVNEFLTDPLTIQDVGGAIERVTTLAPTAKAGKVFAFVGGKGGVGTTTVAVNVATALAKSGTGRVLFVDLHAAHGDAALFFGAEPRFSIVDAFENIHRLDEAFLKGLVVRTKAGLDLLASSDRSMVGAIESQRVQTLIEFVSRYYAHVILDVPRSDIALLDALEMASKVIIVANQELSTVRGAARMASSLRQRYGRERVQVVVTRYDTAAAIGQEDIERATGASIQYLFPSNYRLAVDSLNRGCPIVVENHNKLAGSLVGFARSLAGVKKTEEEEPSKPAGLLGRLTGRR